MFKMDKKERANNGVVVAIETNFKNIVDAYEFPKGHKIIAILEEAISNSIQSIIRAKQKNGIINIIFKNNPKAWLDKVIPIIVSEIHKALMSVARIEYIKNNEKWNNEAFFDGDNITTTCQTMPSKKSLYEGVEYQSDPEMRFIKTAEGLSNIEFYMKLPKNGQNKFHIPTPIGAYYPDFAVVINSNNKLYMVLEIKDKSMLNELREQEAFKIKCAVKYFQSLGFDINGNSHPIIIDSPQEFASLKTSGYQVINTKEWRA